MDKDNYTLPQSDPCYSTLEAYKIYVQDRLYAFAQAFHYQKYGEQIEQWRQCCPRLSKDVEEERPEQPDPEPLQTITLPAHLFNPEGACAEHLYLQGATTPPRGKEWFERELAREQIP